MLSDEQLDYAHSLRPDAWARWCSKFRDALIAQAKAANAKDAEIARLKRFEDGWKCFEDAAEAICDTHATPDLSTTDAYIEVWKKQKAEIAALKAELAEAKPVCMCPKCGDVMRRECLSCGHEID